MGISFSKFISKFFPKRQVRMLMLGLDAAGKTTILYRLKFGESMATIPTIGFNCEEVTFKSLTFNVFDVGGQDKIRPLWRYYYQGVEALLYVVDSNDADRLWEAKDELHKILAQDELREASLLVYANKQDLPKSVPVHQIAEELGLNNLKGRSWYIQSSCAVTGDGLYEGLEWVSTQLKKS
eukprot:GCRY01001554.1.p1 GENE.GCRY01001554.1~~GCRY01001554.1.p1  ORF type:complete len:181 (-),score=46.53 GCRY01001554.1:673-1215(-)